MPRDKRPPEARVGAHPIKIRWAPRLSPTKLARLYELDARGIQDLELCQEVGLRLWNRCRTYVLVNNREVECPRCRSLFRVLHKKNVPLIAEIAIERVSCPSPGCSWFTTPATYMQSIANHDAHTGRALDAFVQFHDTYSTAKPYREQMILIDQLIHSFHLNELKEPVKPVASKLLEGNKKDVVRFLDELSASSRVKRA
jgi:hypothetical protein